MDNYLGQGPDHPFHISVGAVVFNNDGLIAAHHYVQLWQYHDFYLLMRETITPGETLETALARGLREEWGMTARLVTYIGSIVAQAPYDTVRSCTFEKTTLYFLMNFEAIDPATRSTEEESSSTIEWLRPEGLAAMVRAQRTRLGNRDDMDESMVVERAAEIIAPGSNS